MATTAVVPELCPVVVVIPLLRATGQSKTMERHYQGSSRTEQVKNRS